MASFKSTKRINISSVGQNFCNIITSYIGTKIIQWHIPNNHHHHRIRLIVKSNLVDISQFILVRQRNCFSWSGSHKYHSRFHATRINIYLGGLKRKTIVILESSLSSHILATYLFVSAWPGYQSRFIKFLSVNNQS